MKLVDRAYYVVVPLDCIDSEVWQLHMEPNGLHGVTRPPVWLQCGSEESYPLTAATIIRRIRL